MCFAICSNGCRRLDLQIPQSPSGKNVGQHPRPEDKRSSELLTLPFLLLHYFLYLLFLPIPSKEAVSSKDTEPVDEEAYPPPDEGPVEPEVAGGGNDVYHEEAERRARKGIPLGPKVEADLKAVAQELGVEYDL